MANYQTPHNLTRIERGENDTEAQSAGDFHPAQHAQCVTEGTPAHQPPPQTSAAKEADQTIGGIGSSLCVPHAGHSRVYFNPTHTCAPCKATFRNNHVLEQHASKQRHKAFSCICGTHFGRLGSLNRHIEAQSGPKYYCDYCDDSNGFARLDKLIDHLQGSHKFGKNAVAQFRSQARAESKGTGPTSSMVPATGAGQPVSTSAGHDAGSAAVSVGQASFSAGTSSGPSGSFDGGINDFPMFSAAEFQPSAPVEDYSWIGAAEDFAGFDFFGIDFFSVDFVDFDGNMDF